MAQFSMNFDGKQFSVQEKTCISVCLAGDSGDGIQRIGQALSNNAAASCRDVRTMADFPAEIRAPAGTLAGVSQFTLTFAAHGIHTTADEYDVLVAFNPAALKQAWQRCRPGGLILVDEARMTARDWQKAGFSDDPLLAPALREHHSIRVPATTLALRAVTDCGLTHTHAKRCKNFLMLGVVAWLYELELASMATWIKNHWGGTKLCQANLAALRAGYAYAENSELARMQVTLARARLAAGDYRMLNGNSAFVIASRVAQYCSARPLFVAGYPITPASSLLHEFFSSSVAGCQVLQAEDEIAAINACIGAAFAGACALTCTSGPGMDLITESLGLAVMAALPLVVIDVQRAGPSTGMPTKTEQTDLLACVFGRHGECPVPVLAPATAAECFWVLLEAMQTAIRYKTPVIVLSDTHLANATMPWRIPTLSTLAPWPDNPDWVAAGTPNGEHVVGGLETDATTHAVSGCADNHQRQVCARAQKCQSVQTRFSTIEVGGERDSDYCVVGWGSTYGALQTAIESTPGIAYVHCRQLWPLPAELTDVLSRYTHILVVELNEGQLHHLLQAILARPLQRWGKTTGQAVTVRECEQALAAFYQEAPHACRE